MYWTYDDDIRRAQAEDAHEAWWEEYTESVNDAWEDLTILPTVMSIMGNPVHFDSTGMPPWVTVTTELPDALQSTINNGHTASPTAEPKTDPIRITGLTTIAHPSTTIITSVSTQSASGTGQASRIITVFSTLVTYPSITPQPLNTGTNSKPKIIVGVAILAGAALIVILLIGGYMLGRRTSARSEKSGKRTLRRPWPTRKHGDHVESGDQQHLAPSAEEAHELAGGGVVHEMPTKVNMQEMAEVREPVELPASEPIGRDDETG